MRTLHLDLKSIQGEAVELRSFWDNPNDYDSRVLALSEIQTLIRQAEEGYYVSPRLREDLATAGKRLFDWLDGSDRWLVSKLIEHPGELVVLAIAVAGKLAHLPWDVLHDGAQFLVQRMPAIVPLRWQSSDAVTRLEAQSKPENRALNVLFMATSPQNVTPVLDYEQEEAQILKATVQTTIGLTVEESGCLEELGELVESYGKGFFDVVHLTGHATIENGQPYFITETATGEAHLATAKDIAQTLKYPLPKLVFLSGCRTGQSANGGGVPSMAEQLLQCGAMAVLGWGQKVLDTDATAAAAALYGALARGNSVAEAVAATYQALIEQNARDWHLLRLYAAKTLPEALVKPSRTPGWKPAPKASIATAFLDPLTQKVKVPTRESFVGRRRPLQNCLRALTPPSETIAVLIHGMGGLGKSSLAARLCDRLPQFKRLVWQGRIDPQSLVNQLAKALDDRSLRQGLLDLEEELDYRLRYLFAQLAEQGAPPFLLVLDDFEANLEERGTGYVLKPPAVEVLEALVWAIQETNTRHRLILTSRYDFEMSQLLSRDGVVYRQPLDAFQGADLEKKCSRLPAWRFPASSGQASGEAKAAIASQLQLQEQAKQLADGNLRLLETLHDEVLAKPTIDQTAKLNQLAADPTELRKKVLEDRVLQQMQDGLAAVLSRGLVFELPVPKQAFATVCEDDPPLPPLQKGGEIESASLPLLNQAGETESPPFEGRLGGSALIDRAIALGLLEVSPDETVRVPRILPLQLPAQAEPLYQAAARSLYQCWWQESLSEIQALEIIRLGKLAKNEEITVNAGDKIANRCYINALFDKAENLCLEILEDFSNPKILSTLARIENAKGKTEVSIRHYERAISLYRNDNIPEIVNNLARRAASLAQQGSLQQGLQCWEQGIAPLERIDDIPSQAAKLSYIAVLTTKEGKFDEGIEFCEQALELYISLGDTQSAFKILKDIAKSISQKTKNSALEAE